MLWAYQITNLVIAGISGIAAYLSLRAYVKASFNKIDSLHWGISFLLTSFIFLMYFIGKATPVPRYTVVAILLHFMETYALLLQLFIALRLAQAAKNRSNCAIRLTRVISELIKVITLSFFVAFVLLNFNSFYSPFSSCLQLFDLKIGDVIVESGHTFLAIAIAILIPSLSLYNLIKLGFFLRAISEALQAANVYYFQPPTVFLVFLERSFAILGLFSILLGVIAIGQIVKSHDVRKLERRTEETDIKHIEAIVRTTNKKGKTE